MDTTLHDARIRPGLVCTHAPTQPQNNVSGKPPKVQAISPSAAAPSLLAMPASASGNQATSGLISINTDAGTAGQGNERSAALVELVGRVLIEKLFFQHLQIPQDVLLSLMNNVIRTITPERKTKIDLYREGVILSKQFMGKTLTPEEQHYEDALKEIDVPGEILNGIRYSATALMGSNLCSSISSAINQGLWTHVPAIMGYTGAIAFGPKLTQGAVEKALAYSGLTAGQKRLLTPWLNTIGRLALGFMPKISANEQGVHYRLPSVEGHTRIVTPQNCVTLAGEKISVGHPSNAHTTATEYNGMQFKLHDIREITQDKIALTVMDEAGKKIAVEFTAVQNGLDKSIAIKSSDKNLEGYWNQEIRSVLPPMQTRDLTCQSALVMGAVASTVGQNALPALIATLSCWSKVSAFGEIENEQDISTNKRAVMQQQFPAIFDLNSLDGTNGFVVPEIVASGGFGTSVSSAGDINGDGIADLVSGAPHVNTSLGASYVIFGSRSPFSSSFNVTQLNGSNGFAIPGVTAGGQLGLSVNSAGDINGDNITDLVLGAPYANGNQGVSYVIFGSRNPFPAAFNLTRLNGTNGFTIPGVAANGAFGVSVSSAGDINGDNITDLVLGAYLANANLGASYVIFGSRNPFPAFFSLAQLNGTNGFTIPGLAGNGNLGFSVSSAGDINGDNITDLVLGAAGANPGLGTSYVIFGQNTSARILTPTPTPALISSPLTPCPIAQPLTPQNNAIQINQAQTLRLTPNDLSASCGNNTAPNPATLFNITGISHAQFKTRNSNGTWNNASSFLGNDLSQGRVELIQDNSTLAPKINFTITDGQTTLPETAANVQFSTSAIAPTVTAIDFDIQKNGTTTLTPQQFQIISTTTQLDNVVISVTSVENGYFTSGNSSAPISDFTYYQVQDAQIQFAHNGTQLPNMTLTVSDGSGMPVAFTPLVHFFNTDNPANPAVPVEAVVGGAIGAVAVTAAVGVTALGIIKYRQHKEDEAERNHQTPDLKSVANPLQMPATH